MQEQRLQDNKGLTEYIETISKPKRVTQKFIQHPYIEGRYETNS